MVSTVKDPKKVAAGKAGARVRWGDGPPRMVRIADMDPEQRALVHAFVRMAEAVQAKQSGEA